MNEGSLKVSVVIASLGTSVLKNTLDTLAQSDGLVAEVIVVYPRDRSLEIDGGCYDERFRFIPFAGQGQVSQRIYGFNLVNESLTLQLDDDCIIENEYLSRLVTKMEELGNDAVLAPSGYDPAKKRFLGRARKASLIYKLASCMLLGARFGEARMGTISRAGTIYSVDPSRMVKEFIEVEWLPGGCVLHWSKNLINYNYYPFRGRACLEDAMHCVLMRGRGNHLWLSRDIHFITEESEYTEIEGIYEMTRMAMKHLNLIRGEAMWRVDLWYFCSKLKYVLSNHFSFKRSRNS